MVHDVLDELVYYTGYHFNAEEEIMTQHMYPDFDKHKEEHEEFKKKVNALIRDCKSGNLIVSVKAMEYLQNWTIDHILGYDKEYAAYIHAKETGE